MITEVWTSCLVVKAYSVLWVHYTPILFPLLSRLATWYILLAIDTIFLDSKQIIYSVVD